MKRRVLSIALSLMIAAQAVLPAAAEEIIQEPAPEVVEADIFEDSALVDDVQEEWSEDLLVYEDEAAPAEEDLLTEEVWDEDAELILDEDTAPEEDLVPDEELAEEIPEEEIASEVT